MKMFKNAMKYFSKHEMFNSTTHALGGIGVGILITYPLIGSHPVRWAVIFIALAVVGHIWAMTQKP